MKKVELKIVPVTVGGETGDLNYKTTLIGIIKTPSREQGADYEEVRKSIRLLDLLEKANGTLELEDADFDYLRQRVKGARYLVIEKPILDFIEDVTKER